MTDYIDVPNVVREDMGVLVMGRMRISPGNLRWVDKANSNSVQCNVQDIEEVDVTWLANAAGLRILLSDGTLHRFGNLDSSVERVKTFIVSKWKKEVGDVPISICGWNYGKAGIVGSNLQFKVRDQTAFEVPLNNVSNCTSAKNELVIELQPNDESAVALVEMRLFVPQPEGGGDEEESAAEKLRESVLQYAGIESETEQAIIMLPNMPCVQPRGRYDIKVYPTFLSFHGKTYDYKIPKRSIGRLMLLPHRDGRRFYFVVQVNPPIRQGLTRYNFIVFEFNKDAEIDVELALTDEQIKTMFSNSIERRLSGPLHQIVAKFFRVYTNIKVTLPSEKVKNAVSCSHKQSHGFLYIMDAGFLYVPKPTVYLDFHEVALIAFARNEISTRTFDLEIQSKGGVAFVFNTIGKDEFDPIQKFCKEKSLPLQNMKELKAAAINAALGEDDDEVDAYKERLKSDAADDESLSEESEDEDYDFEKDAAKRKAKPAEDSEATDGSEPDEEYDTGDDEVEDEAAGKSSKKRTKSDDDDEDDTEKPAKKSKSSSEPKKSSKSDKSSSKASKNESKAKGKAKKDPNAPKRPMSAYMLWYNELRPSLAKKGLSVAEAAKEGGRLWKEVDDATKKKYEKLYADDKVRYERQMTEYKKTNPVTPAKAAAASSPKKSVGGGGGGPSPSKAKSKEFVSSSSESEDSDDGEAAKTAAAAKKKAGTPSDPESSDVDSSNDDSD